MRAAALASAEREERDWQQMAELAATPEWGRHAGFAGACAVELDQEGN